MRLISSVIRAAERTLDVQYYIWHRDLSGTLLFAFAIVCLGIWVLRKKDPHTHRPFKTPFVPLVPLLGAAVCFTMMVSLGKQTIVGAMVWLSIGLVIYFGYGRHRSKLNAKS